MKPINLIYRKKTPSFNSIENVFNTLLPFLPITKVELPYLSSGIKKRIKNTLFIHRKKASIYHITGNDHYLLIGLKKNKHILTVHDIEILKRTKGLKKIILKKLWFDIPIKRAKVITTISNFTKKELLELNTYSTPIKVIYNPLTLPVKFTPKEFNIECPSILHLGTKQNKNIYRLIESISGLNCNLKIIGKESHQLIASLKKHNITYTIKSNLTTKEIITEYFNCDILSFVSTYEGFGLPIIEAQAIGRAIITSNISSMPEIAGNGAIFVNPYSIEEIRKGILKLINDSYLRDKLVKNGLKNIKRFDPKQIANKYTQLYESINQ